MAATLSRVINLREPFFPQSFLPASLPGSWEQLVSFQLLGICSCQEVQPFSPWPVAQTWLGFIRSYRGLFNVLLWLPPHTQGEDASPRLQVSAGSRSRVPGLGAPY